MNKFLKILLAASAAAGLSSQAVAASVTCPATSITNIGQRVEGTVTVYTSYGSFIFCNVSASFYDVSAETCRGWVAQLLTARGLNKPVTFHFDTGHAANTNMNPDVNQEYCFVSNFNSTYRVPYFVEVDFTAL